MTTVSIGAHGRGRLLTLHSLALGARHAADAAAQVAQQAGTRYLEALSAVLEGQGHDVAEIDFDTVTVDFVKGEVTLPNDSGSLESA